jgi:uncharacterized membrane protein
MDKKKLFGYAVIGLAIYGGIKAAKKIKSKGGIMAALNLKK